MSSPIIPPKGEVKSESDVIDLTRASPFPTPPPVGAIVLQDPDTEDIIVVSEKQVSHTHHRDPPSSMPTKRDPLTDLSNSQRPPLHIVGNINIGQAYDSFEEGQAEVYALEARQGHIWRIGQTKKVNDQPKRITLRCNHYHRHTPTHLPTIDPSDYRRGKTIKTDCMAHVNITRSAADGTWHVTMTNWNHNHPPQVPPGGSIPRPPTKEQRELVSRYANNGNFSRSQLAKVLAERFPNHLLEPRQITNMQNTARKEAREDINRLGGDAASILDSLARKAETEHGWRYSVRLDSDQVLAGIFWQSPAQVALAKRYYDILLNDDTYNRNQYGK